MSLMSVCMGVLGGALYTTSLSPQVQNIIKVASVTAFIFSCSAGQSFSKWSTQTLRSGQSFSWHQLSYAIKTQLNAPKAPSRHKRAGINQSNSKSKTDLTQWEWTDLVFSFLFSSIILNLRFWFFTTGLPRGIIAWRVQGLVRSDHLAVLYGHFHRRQNLPLPPGQSLAPRNILAVRIYLSRLNRLLLPLHAGDQRKDCSGGQTNISTIQVKYRGIRLYY